VGDHCNQGQNYGEERGRRKRKDWRQVDHRYDLRAGDLGAHRGVDREQGPKVKAGLSERRLGLLCLCVLNMAQNRGPGLRRGRRPEVAEREHRKQDWAYVRSSSLLRPLQTSVSSQEEGLVLGVTTSQWVLGHPVGSSVQLWTGQEPGRDGDTVEVTRHRLDQMWEMIKEEAQSP
jgi:hypothetical protein